MPYMLNPRVPEMASDLLERFKDALGGGAKGEKTLADVVKSILRDVETRTFPHRIDYLKARAIFEIFEDVLRLYWRFESNGHLIAHPPDLSASTKQDVEKVKSRIQDSLTAARNEQLQEKNNVQFVQDMEKPRTRNVNGVRREVSVCDLFLSPKQLADDLRSFASSPVHEQLARLTDIIKPYLQPVDSEAVDAYTGLRLLDIWRYARFTWSIPYSQVPGRRMLYLVRDKAREFHPIIGIGALGSGVMQLTPRDRQIGWSPLALARSSKVREHVEQEVEKEPTPKNIQSIREQAFLEVFGSETRDVIAALMRQLDEALDYIYLDDFVEKGLLSTDDLDYPTEESLENIDAARNNLNKASSNREFAATDDYERDAQSDLYARKRATSLKRLLKAKRVLLNLLSETKGVSDEELRGVVVSKETIRRALKMALRSVKKRRIAGLMDITTCGALPPYNEVLGGKLVSFLMASPQVIADYRKRYRNQESVIASRMKGEPVIRNPELVLLSTTSLYAVGSSQYNRLDAPTANGQLEYKHIGESSGHGHIHISRRTFQTLTKLLKELAEQEGSGVERPNYRFGNGVNYRMRTIKAALTQLGLQPLHQHEHPRLIYLVPLAKNWREYLTGEDNAPEYIYSDTENNPQQETKALADYWKMRWFYERAQKEFVIERLETEYQKIQVSDLIPSESCTPDSTPLFEEQVA